MRRPARVLDEEVPALDSRYRAIGREIMRQLARDFDDAPALWSPPALSQAERLEVLEVRVARAERYLEWAAYGVLGFLVFVWLIAAVRR